MLSHVCGSGHAGDGSAEGLALVCRLCKVVAGKGGVKERHYQPYDPAGRAGGGGRVESRAAADKVCHWRDSHFADSLSASISKCLLRAEVASAE